jgi:PAS domain S-box-containing protein
MTTQIDLDQQYAILAAIVESSEDAIISKNLDGIITSWNKSAEVIFGYPQEEAIGKHISILIPIDRLGEEEMIITRLRQGKRIEHYETIRQSKSGKQIPISLSISPIRNTDGIVVGASKIVRDITRQKEAESVINRYIKQLEQLNEAGNAIVSALKIEDILQKVTDSTTRLCGAAFGAFFYNITDVRMDKDIVYALSGLSKETFERPGIPPISTLLESTFKNGLKRSDNIAIEPGYEKNKSGGPFWHLPVVSYLAIPIYSKKNVLIGGLFFGHPQAGIFKDEHEKLIKSIVLQAVTALENAKLFEQIERLNNRKDEFISFASHELKTPLTTISGYLELSQTMPEKAQSFYPKISKQVTRLSAIISDLLDITKIQAGRMELNFAPVSLTALANDSIEAVRLLYPKREIETSFLEEDCMVNWDNQKMSQVFINVLTNAVKYSEPDTKVIMTTLRRHDRIRISIKDFGVGIAPENIQKIFSQFFRVKKPGYETEGLGLGLYFSSEIIDGHHGKIWAESIEGQTSTFYIDIPVNPA